MKGRGLLIAAAVIQLCGAAFAVIAAMSSLFMMPAMMGAMPNANAANVGAAENLMRGIGIFYLAIAGLMIWVSVKLIQMRRWAFIVSLVMSSLSGAFILLGIIGAAIGGSMLHQRQLGAAEAIMLIILGSPVFVTIGLLIGGRGATVGAAAPRA
jgi:hypothetical protein